MRIHDDQAAIRHIVISHRPGYVALATARPEAGHEAIRERHNGAGQGTPRALAAMSSLATPTSVPRTTIYAAIIREIAKKGDASRFRKTERGKFELAK